MNPTRRSKGGKSLQNGRVLGLILVFLFQAIPGVIGRCRAAAPAPDGRLHRFAAREQQFFIDDQPIRFIAGEIHPGRIPAEFWEDRIRKARAMGLNAISVYLFWNQIEPQEGKFVFEGMTDIRHFVQLCADNGLWVIVRAGPYVCAEDEFGGFPAWLLKHHDMRIRTDDPAFLDYSRKYVGQLYSQLGDLQISHGGPIVMMQIENELRTMNPYLTDVRDIFVRAGFDTQLFTCDPSGPVWNQPSIPGVLRAYNGMTSDSALATDRRVAAPEGFPAFSPEIYTGWFNIWGGTVQRRDIPTQLKTVQWLLDQKNLSWAFYVFDGGTNFGFSASSHNLDPVQTTYDYDAPIDELGRVTPKYKALRDLFVKEMNLSLPDIPPDPAVIDIPEMTLSRHGSLVSRLPGKPVESHDVVPMEDLDQSYGFVLYRKHFESGLAGKLVLGPRTSYDYSFVMVNGVVIGESWQRGLGESSMTIALNHPGSCDLEILVHNLGRTSSPFNQATSRKGLTANPTLDGQPLADWQIYSLPMNDPDVEIPLSDNAIEASPATGPEFYSGKFDLASPGESYLDMSNWHFGVVWVNGHNLGRFWNVGATRSLYLPSVWQKRGTNQITVLELGKPPVSATLKGTSSMAEIQVPNSPYYLPQWVKPADVPVGPLPPMP